MAKNQTIKKKKFESRYANYKKYVQVDGKEVLIRFQGGIYETDNPKIIKILTNDPLVREVEEVEEKEEIKE